MPNPEHLAILKQGVQVWNRWRRESPNTEPDLSGAVFERLRFRDGDLTGVDLHDASLKYADLIRAGLVSADLSFTDLECARLWNARLNHVNLQNANLKEAEFDGADLSSANLNRSLMWNVNFSGAVLSESDLTDAHLSQVNFDGAILKNVKGLDSCYHVGTSRLNLSTLLNSDPLPPTFLRGCGLHKNFIQSYLSATHSMLNSWFDSCFISYSARDQEFADKLHADLQDSGVCCWFAPHDIRGGRKLHEQIDEAIHIYDRLLLILSEHSIASEWVKTEIANARQRELREKRQMLFPISLVPFEKIKEWKAFDADTGKDSAREIREYFIPDFSNWKNHDSYQAAFQRLLRDLKADSEL